MSKTQLTMVVDRSGSMDHQSVKASAGINALIDKQKAEPDSCYLLLNDFDDQHQTIHSGPVKRFVGPYIMRARNATALLDAIGKGVNQTDVRIKKTGKAVRPQLVVFVIVTDGEENCSTEFTKEEIYQLVSEKKTQGWQFIYMCADNSAARYGKDLGIENVQIYDTSKSLQVYESTNSLVSRMRSDSREGRVVRNSFTAVEINAIK